MKPRSPSFPILLGAIAVLGSASPGTRAEDAPLGDPTAQAPAAPQAAPQLAPRAIPRASGAPAVLSFEGDVIEGEKKRPDVFIQIGKDSQTMDSVIFMRKDFNDYHRLDSRLRPDYVETGR